MYIFSADFYNSEIVTREITKVSNRLSFPKVPKRTTTSNKTVLLLVAAAAAAVVVVVVVTKGVVQLKMYYHGL